MNIRKPDLIFNRLPMYLPKHPLNNLAFIALFFLFLTSCAPEKHVEIGKLVNVKTLHEAIAKDELYLLIGLQDKEEFAGKHLEGAINISRKELESKAYPYGGMVASAQEVETLFSKLGIKATDNIVI